MVSVYADISCGYVTTYEIQKLVILDTECITYADIITVELLIGHCELKWHFWIINLEQEAGF